MILIKKVQLLLTCPFKKTDTDKVSREAAGYEQLQLLPLLVSFPPKKT